MRRHTTKVSTIAATSKPTDDKRGDAPRKRSALPKSRLAAATLCAATAAVYGLAPPAFAANSTNCTALPYWVIGKRTCKTGTLHANAAHDIRIIVRSDVFKCTESPWHVWDVNTGVTIAKGVSVPRNLVVHGLYGTYRGRLDNACWKDVLELRDY